MQQDADGAGEVCRRNNRAYAGGPAAGPFNYPSGLFTAQRTGSCPTVPGFATVPRHYWKTSVEWCATKITTSNDKWRGFGQPGTCQDEHDATHPYPRFYKWGVPKTDPAYLDNYANPAFERVDLAATTPTYTHTYWKNGAWQTVTRTYAQEMTNYANWFAYYRTRIQAAKTVISQNFTFLDTDFMVGFHTLSNTPGTSYVDPKLFDALVGGQKDKWYQQLFGIQIKMGQQTPNIDAVVRIGELYKGGGNPSLSGSIRPDQAVVPEELPHAVHRRHHQPDGAAVHDGRQPRRHRAAAAAAAGGGRRRSSPVRRGRTSIARTRPRRWATRSPTTRRTTGSPTCVRR